MMPGDWTEVAVRERMAELRREAERERLSRRIRSGRDGSRARRIRSARWDWAAWLTTARARLLRRQSGRRHETLAEQGDRA